MFSISEWMREYINAVQKQFCNRICSLAFRAAMAVEKLQNRVT